MLAPLDLVATVRQLLDHDAPRDPDQAGAAFDALVERHGRALMAAALITVAGDELAHLR